MATTPPSKDRFCQEGTFRDYPQSTADEPSYGDGFGEPLFADGFGEPSYGDGFGEPSYDGCAGCNDSRWLATTIWFPRGIGRNPHAISPGIAASGDNQEIQRTPVR
jgi:hypothetical protein